MEQLTHKTSSNGLGASTKPAPDGAVAFRRSELIIGFNGIDDGGAGGDHHGIDVEGDIEAAALPMQVNEEQNPSMSGNNKPSQSKINLNWAKTKLHSFIKCPEWNEKMDNRRLRDHLFQAALKGDWKIAKSIETRHPGALSMEITDRNETALHIATRVMKASFVRKLVEHLDPHDLKLKNRYGNTALCIAAASGVVGIAKLMVSKYGGLTLIRGSGNATPLLIAASYEHRRMVSYLLSKTPVYGLTIQEQMELLVGAISADYYDMALLILNWNKSLALERDFNGDTPLHIMARKSSGAIGGKDKPTMWESSINSSFKCIYKKTMMQIQARKLVIQMWEVVMREIPKDNVLEFINRPSSMLHDAARVGNVEFMRVLIHSYPDLAWKADEEGKSIFHEAVETRQESVLSLIYEMGEFLDYLPTYYDEEKMGLLELAAKMPDPSHLNRVSGAAFQMHRELLWFKEVEKIEKLTMRRKKGKKSARELFTEEHKNLVEEGEKWMKKTANSCMLVATLIATVVFAAGFTLPGGVNNDTGSPLFLPRKWFAVFVISDAIALISSSTSILVFLSILTSRCAEDDFLFRLPLKLAWGLGTLFLSVMTMVMAFSASFFLSYGNDTAWVPLVIAGMAIVPVYIFFMLQYKLWADTMAALQATWMSCYLLRNRKRKAFWMSNIVAPLKKNYEIETSCIKTYS